MPLIHRYIHSPPQPQLRSNKHTRPTKPEDKSYIRPLASIPDRPKKEKKKGRGGGTKRDTSDATEPNLTTQPHRSESGGEMGCYVNPFKYKFQMGGNILCTPWAG